MPSGAVGARQVGEFPNNDRKVIRSKKNPIDKCTIVSIFPKYIKETKPSIEPGIFEIQPGTYESPSTLPVGSSSWWKDINDTQPLLEIPVSSVQVADAIIRDYNVATLGYRAGKQAPGLFFVLGAITIDEIKKIYFAKLLEVKLQQDAWFLALTKIADSLWARSNGNPLSIHDDMRLAANCLNLVDKPWLKDYKMIEMIKCNGCGSLKNPGFPVCPVCKVIDQNHPGAKDLKFA